MGGAIQIINNGLIYLINDQDIAAINDQDGSVRWKQHIHPHYTLTVLNNYLYSAFNDIEYNNKTNTAEEMDKIISGVVAIDKSSGSIIWKKIMGNNDDIFYPVVMDNILIVAKVAVNNTENAGGIFALNPTNGREFWHFSSNPIAAPIIYNGNIYFKTNDAIYCLDLQTGKPLSKFDLPIISEKLNRKSIVINNNTLYTIVGKTLDDTYTLLAIHLK